MIVFIAMLFSGLGGFALSHWGVLNLQISTTPPQVNPYALAERLIICVIGLETYQQGDGFRGLTREELLTSIQRCTSWPLHEPDLVLADLVERGALETIEGQDGQPLYILSDATKARLKPLSSSDEGYHV